MREHDEQVRLVNDHVLFDRIIYVVIGQHNADHFLISTLLYSRIHFFFQADDILFSQGTCTR